jgi:thiol-disulfide isomerase/thioredoxin
MMKRLITAVFAALLAATIPASLPAQSKSAATPAAGHLAPDFTRPSLDGKPLKLSAYRGKVVLLNFWATWCGPCIAEIPKFSEWQTKYAAQGLQIVGVSMDDDHAPVDKFNRKYKPTYPIVMGDERLGNQYGGVLGLPISYLIGADGKVIERYQGETNLVQMEKRITAALPKK